MKEKILRIIFCTVILIGTLLGSGVKEKEEKEISDSTSFREMHETGNALSAVAETIPKAENAAVEECPEVKNSFDMPLMENTALLVTVEKCRSDYERIAKEYEYDREGRMLRHLKDDIVEFTDTEYEYNEEGNLLKETRYIVDEDDLKLKYWVEYSYGKDETGQPIRTEREYYANGSLSEECVYDREERRLRKTSYRESGLLWSEYEYDTSTKQQWYTSYDEEGHAERRHRTDYDDRENTILYAEYDAEGNIIYGRDCACDQEEFYFYWRVENNYDAAGNLVRQTVFDLDGKQTGHTENTYDDHGNLLKTVSYDGSNAITYYVENTYDEKDNLVCEYSFDEYDERLIKTGYEYDASGHCVKRWAAYGDCEVDEEGNLTVDSKYVICEKEYDDRDRLLKYTDCQDKEWYNFIYTVVGDSDEDYPYDRINVSWF